MLNLWVFLLSVIGRIINLQMIDEHGLLIEILLAGRGGGTSKYAEGNLCHCYFVNSTPHVDFPCTEPKSALSESGSQQLRTRNGPTLYITKDSYSA